MGLEAHRRHRCVTCNWADRNRGPNTRRSANSDEQTRGDGVQSGQLGESTHRLVSLASAGEPGLRHWRSGTTGLLSGEAHLLPRSGHSLLPAAPRYEERSAPSPARRGDSTVASIDLYDYLLRGVMRRAISGWSRATSSTLRSAGASSRCRAPCAGSMYELLDGEGFSTLLQFAGGLLPTAATNRLQIDRVLPPAERAPGRERAIIDVPFDANYGLLDSVRVDDKDSISVFSVGDIRRNRVELRGEVYQPGMYEWSVDLTLGRLAQQAQGFLPQALNTDRAKAERPDNSYRPLRVVLVVPPRQFVRDVWPSGVRYRDRTRRSVGLSGGDCRHCWSRVQRRRASVR